MSPIILELYEIIKEYIGKKCGECSDIISEKEIVEKSKFICPDCNRYCCDYCVNKVKRVLPCKSCNVLKCQHCLFSNPRGDRKAIGGSRNVKCMDCCLGEHLFFMNYKIIGDEYINSMVGTFLSYSY